MIVSRRQALALSLIRRWEKLRLNAYLDSGGVATIGYGHTRGVKIGDVCTEGQANEWLAEDAGPVFIVAQTLPSINGGQFAAVSSLGFNIGYPSLDRSTLARMIRTGRVEQAAAQFDRWVFDAGLRVQGLVNRRAHERKIYEGKDNEFQ